MVEAQQNYFDSQKQKANGKYSADFAVKALNYAVLSAWAYTAGMLHENNVRLPRHYGLREAKGKDPLNAAVLAKGRHKTDKEQYRGLGYRTDPKERGRFVELFYAQAERGNGITKTLVDYAIKQYHAKLSMIDALEAKEKV